MKKTAIAAATTFAALSTMLIAPAAHAEPYPRSINTQCVANVADNTISPSANARVRFTWTADGNVSPRGSVKFVVKRANNGVVVKRGSFFVPRSTETKTFKLAFENEGKFLVKFRTNTGPSSVFQNCQVSTENIKVRDRF
jgi:hypothetical protein